MSLIYYLICHEKKIAVAIGDDAAGEPYIWDDQIPFMNQFLWETKGYNIQAVTDEDPGYDDWIDEYEVLGKYD